MTRKKTLITPHRVVYLIGAGATQAEVSLKYDYIKTTMKDIKDGILGKISSATNKELSSIRTELLKEGADVEHLITLYESTGIKKHELISKRLKELFVREIEERLARLPTGYIPKLLTALLDMHEIPELNEKLFGFITLNYDDFIERSIQETNEGVDYSVQIRSRHDHLKVGSTKFPLLKLHGSFNWKNEFPITLRNERNIKSVNDVLWIPPGVEKKREKYPFNMLWGRAREVLDCDILRVIGCSLSRNDWQLISLLHTTQQLRSEGKGYNIELIDYHDAGKRVCDMYSYLSCRIVSEIKEVRNYLIPSFTAGGHVGGVSLAMSKSIEELLNNPKTNIFDTWLKAKGEALKSDGVPITTPKKYFENFINEVT
jgi:hypothetical protein